MNDQDQSTTHFGYRTVAENQKSNLVKDVFTSVASRYDLMNDLMSLGIHRIWKDAMMDWLAPRPGQNLLDVAGGTGDIACRFLRRAKGGRATVLDFSEAMLVEGRHRSEVQEFGDHLNWVVGDAMSLPFPNNSFDVYTVSFGLRNVTQPATALSEAWRVLKYGGRLMVLEFGRMPNDSLQYLYDSYSFEVIPRLGHLIVRDRDSYRYLVESIRKFSDQETFLEAICRAGFENSKYRNLSMGIAALYSGWKI